MTTLAEDLEYLRKEAFQFDLTVNPHSVFHERIDEFLKEDETESWISQEQQQEAYRTGRFVNCTVYPNGSVTFWEINGTSIEDVVRFCAETCRSDRARYAVHTPEPTTSRAFEPTPLPEK